MFSPYKDGITITKGHKYRFCVRGYGQGGKSTTQLSFYMFDLNGKVVGKRALSTKSYGTSSATHSSAEFNASKASYRVNGSIYVPSGSNNTFIAEKLSVEYLR